jgi:hypothetical protein
MTLIRPQFAERASLMIPSREFVRLYVSPAIDDWKAAPDAVHRAVAALIQIDILAEVVFEHLKARGAYPRKPPHQPNTGKNSGRASLCSALLGTLTTATSTAS